jgi:hypothetical protein
MRSSVMFLPYRFPRDQGRALPRPADARVPPATPGLRTTSGLPGRRVPTQPSKNGGLSSLWRPPAPLH